MIFVDIRLAVQYAKLSGVTPLMEYSDNQLRTELHHRQAISWEYNEPVNITTTWEMTTRRHLVHQDTYSTMADLKRSEGVELTKSIGRLWRIAAQIRGFAETSAKYEEERERMIGAYSTLTERCRTYIESLSVFYHEEDRLQIHNGVQEDAMQTSISQIHPRRPRTAKNPSLGSRKESRFEGRRTAVIHIPFEVSETRRSRVIRILDG